MSSERMALCPYTVSHGKEERLFFSEEKKQKIFVFWRVRQPDHVRQVTKVFWFLFSKKNKLSCCAIKQAPRSCR
jgi:hypothetical protein